MSSNSKTLRAFASSRETKKQEAMPALVPKLRFPEFRKAAGWEYAQLGKLLKKSPDYGVNAAAVPFTQRLPQYLRITDISEDGRYLSAKKVSVDLEPREELFLDEGDVVLTRTGASVGKSYRYRKEDGRLVFAGFLIRVKPDPKRLVSAYLANFLTTEQYWKWVAATSARSGQPGINSVEYSSLAIPLPADFPEQQKIAECLSSVDELIAAQARKLDALKTHKKGLMQQLFPREGETQPLLRFPEFQNAGKWVTETLGQLASYENGKAYEQDITESGRYVVVNSRFISTDGAVRKYTNADYLIAETGEVLMVLSDLPKGKALAKCYFVDADDRYAVNQRVCRLKPTRIDGKFLYYVLNRHLRLLAYDDGLSQTHLSKGGVTECPLCVPPHKAEQQRIATCLSSLDALITAETQKHESLKTHKKGLMQQLFPSPEEVEA